MKISFRVALNNPMRSKATGVRMGSGKGKTKFWVCNIKKGSIIVEIDNYPTVDLKNKIISFVKQKLHVNTKLVVKK